MYGSRCANFSVQNSDLVFCLGTRLDTRTTGGVPRTFARNAKKIVVDIDKHEFDNGLKSTKMVQIQFRQKSKRSVQNSKNRPKSIKY